MKRNRTNRFGLTLPPGIGALQPYVPGKPIEAVEREYGITDSIKLASNENPLGPSPRAVAAVERSLAGLHRYPEGGAPLLVRRLAETLGVSEKTIVLGNGSDEVIGMLTRVFLNPGDEAILPAPAFLMYEIMVRCDGAVPVPVPLRSMAIDLEGMADRIGPRTRMIFLTNPNNPTGGIIRKAAFEAFLEKIPSGMVVVVDEAYIEFVRNPDCARGIDHLTGDRPVAVLRTFSKAYGLAGLRIGYGVMPPELAEPLNRIRQPFNTSIPAQAGAAAALEDTEFLRRTLETVHEGIDYICYRAAALGLAPYPTEANFVLIRLNRSADAVFEAMLRRGVIVRSMTAYGYPDHIRVTAGTRKENRRLMDVLSDVAG